jgi:ribose 5-phosphate isomerase B
MRIALAADHGGVDLKTALAERLRDAGHDVVDHGTDGSVSVDYPDFARKVTAAVLAGEADRGILICGTGQGMAMSANKVPGIRAGVCADPFSARMIAEHNNAQVLCLGARVLGVELAWAVAESYLGATFAGGRHQRRVSKMESAS